MTFISLVIIVQVVIKVSNNITLTADQAVPWIQLISRLKSNGKFDYEYSPHGCKMTSAEQIGLF